MASSSGTGSDSSDLESLSFKELKSKITDLKNRLKKAGATPIKSVLKHKILKTCNTRYDSISSDESLLSHYLKNVIIPKLSKYIITNMGYGVDFGELGHRKYMRMTINDEHYRLYYEKDFMKNHFIMKLTEIEERPNDDPDSNYIESDDYYKPLAL